MTDKASIVERIKALSPESQQKLVKSWPKDVPSLKLDGHTAEQLRTLRAILAVIEEEAGSGVAVDADHNRKKVHAACQSAFGNGDEERHALIEWATSGEKSSTVGLTDEEVQAVVDAAARVELGDLVLGWTDAGKAFWREPSTEDVAEMVQRANDHAEGPTPIDWRAVAKDRGVTQAALLRTYNEWTADVGKTPAKTLAAIDSTDAAAFLAVGSDVVEVSPSSVAYKRTFLLCVKEMGSEAVALRDRLEAEVPETRFLIVEGVTQVVQV